MLRIKPKKKINQLKNKQLSEMIIGSKHIYTSLLYQLITNI